MSKIVDDFIARGCWSPQRSGYRPLRSSDEAKVLLADPFVFRGTTGYLNHAVAFFDDSVLIRWQMSGNEFTATKTYRQLFIHAKLAGTNYPIGLPGEMTPAELLECWR